MTKFGKEKIFLRIAIFTGVLLIFLTPPLSVPDENVHFLNSFAVSQGNLLPKVQDNSIGRAEPQAIINFTEYYHNIFAGNLDQKYSFTEYYFNSWANVDMETKVFYSYWGADAHPAGYFISGLGMAALGAITTLVQPNAYTPYNLLTFGRLFNLVFYIIVTYYAIKITPYYKNLMMLIALMPMSIFMAASLSYDAVLIPACFLLFSYTMMLKESNKIINIKDITIIVLISMAFGGIKQVYIPLLLILFTIPLKQFKNKKQYFIAIACVAGSCLAVYALYNILLNSIRADMVGQWDTVQEQQLNIILGSPLGFLKVIINSLMKYKSYYLFSFWGCLGQLDTNFPFLLILSYLFIMLLIFILESGLININLNSMKILSFAGISLTIYAIFAGTYIIWTGMSQTAGVGADFVDGVQGRYFIPVSIFIGMMFSHSRWIKKDLTADLCIKAEQITSGSVALICLMTLFTVFTRYWV